MSVELEVGERITHKDLRSDDITVPQIHGCARCGKRHGQTTFQRLENPIKIENDSLLTHWAPCPNNGQPILFGVQTLAELYPQA